MTRRRLVTPAQETSTFVPEWQRPIIAVPLAQHLPDLAQVKEFRSKQVLLNHDRTRLFDVVSDKYRVLPHSEALGTVETALEKYFGKSHKAKAQIRALDGGARVLAEYKLPIEPIRVGRDDINELTIVVRNSYDRSWPLDATLGAFRLICSNGMRIGEEFGSLSLKHIGTESTASVLSHLDSVISRAPKLQDVWEEWASTRVERDDAAALLEGQFPSKYLDPVLGDRAVYPMTKWQLYNHLTRFATHDTKSLRRRVEFDERISKLFYNPKALAAPV